MTEVNNLDDITQQSNQNNADTKNENQQQQPNNGGSKQIVLGCDINQNDAEYQQTVAGIIEQAGYTVEKLAIEPNAFASYSYDSKAKGKIGIYLIAAGTFSIGDATYGGTNFDYNYFGIRPECSPNWDVEDFDTKPIGADADSRVGGTDKIAGHTFKEINQIVKSRSMCVTGKDATEMGNNLVAALGGQVAGGNTTNTNNVATAVSIPDKTFYGLIKQIMGAVDATFIIANNMAYLLSFKDIYEYRNQYDELIPKIEKKDILENSLTKNWTSSGFYNAVEVTYSDGIIKYQNDDLVKQYGENVFYYNFPQDDEETAKAKADALLSAHIRDYSTDIHLSIFYNEHITEGGWVKVHKDITKILNKATNEKQQNNNNVSTKHKGITIENIIEKTITQDNITKTIQSITDEEKNTFDIEIEKNEYELFFVQAYTCRWDKKNSLIMDLELKYGPDTPEDPINATISTGGGNSTAMTATGGNYGNDSFTIDDICVANNEKILGPYAGGEQVQTVKELVNGKYAPEPSDYQPRANKNSNYAKKYSQMKSPAEVYAAFRSEYRYSYYADNSSCWKNATDFYDNAGKTANCGDSTCLLKVFFDCIGVPSCGVHIDGHYFNAIQLNGTWEIIDGVRLDNQTCNFADGSGYSSGNPYPCDSYKGGSS